MYLLTKQSLLVYFKDEQVFLTMVNTQGWDANLKDLDKYLLKALFNCMYFLYYQFKLNEK